jgi:hypothetical protein
MLGKFLLPEVRELIASGDEETLREILNRWSPADVVELFDALSDEEDLAGIKMMSGPQRARVFEYPIDANAQPGVPNRCELRQPSCGMLVRFSYVPRCTYMFYPRSSFDWFKKD